MEEEAREHASCCMDVFATRLWVPQVERVQIEVDPKHVFMLGGVHVDRERFGGFDKDRDVYTDGSCLHSSDEYLAVAGAAAVQMGQEGGFGEGCLHGGGRWEPGLRCGWRALGRSAGGFVWAGRWWVGGEIRLQ